MSELARDTMKAINEALGAAARESRTAQGMTLQAAVDKAAAEGHTLSTSLLSQLENGKASWTSRRLAAVTAAVRVRFPYWVLAGSARPQVA